MFGIFLSLTDSGLERFGVTNDFTLDCFGSSNSKLSITCLTKLAFDVRCLEALYHIDWFACFLNLKLPREIGAVELKPDLLLIESSLDYGQVSE
jgi:hypothetical protein